MLTAIALSFTAWGLTILALVILLYTEKLPSEIPNMVFYLILQAAVPMTIFWWLMRRAVIA
jgi:hypothetical protein